MDKNQFHRIIKDLPAKKFHSCILSTFSFDYNFFDIQIRRQLQRIGIMNTIVLVDARQLDDSFARFSQNTNYLLKDYTVILVENKLCFHPKVMLFFGEDNMAMHVGSGNLTSGGLGKNHELFSTLICGNIESNLHSLINCGANYLLSFLEQKKGFVQKQVEWIFNHCNLLSRNETYSDVTNVEITSDSTISFLSNKNESIYTSLIRIIPSAEVIGIDIVSPFFDKNCNLINQLIIDFPNSDVNVFLQDGKVEYNFNACQSDKLSYYDWSSTEIGKTKFKSGEKYNHSKVFIFKSANKSYFFHGSANATISAFGLANLYNNEAGLLYESSVNEFNIGLQPKVEFDVHTFVSKKNIPSPTESVKKQSRHVSILGADQYKDAIDVYLTKEQVGDIINLVDCYDNVIHNITIDAIEEKYLITNLSMDVVSSINALYIERENNKVSNIYYPSKIEYLLKCNPSKENRKFQKFLYDIEIGNTNSFEIISRLELLLKEKGKADIKKKKSYIRSTTTNENVTYTYEDALKSKKILDSEVDKNIKNLHHSLELLFFIKQYLKEDKSFDQDEGGFKTGGGNTANTSDDIFKKKKVFLSVNAFEKRQSGIIQYFITYASYLRSKSQLNELNNKKDYNITSSDLIFIEQSLFHLLSFADKDLEVKHKMTISSEGDAINDVRKKEEVKEELLIRKALPLRGLLNNKDSFYSLLRMLLGEFGFYLMGGTFYDYDDKYSVLEQEKYRNSCKKYYMTCLCIYHTLFSQSDDEVELWYYIGEQFLGKINEEDITEVIFNTQFSALKVDQVVSSYNELKDINIQPNGQVGHYFRNEDGIFIVDSIVPPHNPTIFKLNFPGIGVLECNSDDVPFNYYKPQDRWLRSKSTTLSV